MTNQKDLKRLIRARMAETGESYTVARSHILRERIPPLPPHLPDILRTHRNPDRQRDRIRVRIDRGGNLGLRRPRATPANWLSLALPIPVLIIILLMALSACSPPDTSSSGIPVVVLHERDVHVLATSVSIASVADLDVLTDGSIWVLNSLEPLFVGFDATGSPSGTHGRLGGGPEEFGVPAGFVVGGINGNAWVFDAQRHSLVQVSDTTVSRSEIPLPAGTFPIGSVLGTNPTSPLVRTERMGNEVLLPRRKPGDLDVAAYWNSVWLADLVALNVQSGASRDLVALGDVLGDPSDHFDLGVAPLPFPLWYRLWTVCSPDTIRVYDRLRNQLRGFTVEGVEIDAILLPPTELSEVPAREFARVIFDLLAMERMGAVPAGGITMASTDSSRVIRSAIPRIAGTPGQLADLLPKYVDLHCDDEGKIWIQRFDIDFPGSLMNGLRGSRRWLHVAPDGNIREIRMPERFDPLRFTPETIWGVLRDELDVASVAWIAVP